MTNRDPNTPPRDHTPAIIVGVVVLFGLLVILAIGLEWTKSSNTMAIIGTLGAGIGAVIFTQLFALNRQTQAVREAADVAVAAKGIAEDTNVRAQEIQHQLNGGLTKRLQEIVRGELAAFDAPLDARIRAGVTAVLTEREGQRDAHIREIVRDELNTNAVACRVLVPEGGAE